MVPAMFRRTGIGVAAALVVLHAAAADDWPRWRGPGNDGHVPAGAPVPSALPASPKILWQKPLGPGMGSPSVAGGGVFIMEAREGREAVRCLDAKTGGERWAAAIDEVIRDSQGDGGPRGTPLVDGARVYAASCRGELVCLDAADGKPIWRRSYTRDFGACFLGAEGDSMGASRYGNTASPAIDGDRLFACAGGTNGASVICLDKRDGKEIWRSQDDIAGYASPILADLGGVRQLVCFTAVAAIGLRADTGALLWRVPVKTGAGRHVTTPVVAGDLVVVSSHQAGLLAVRVTRDGEAFRTELAWSNKTAAINYASPVAAGGHLYGLGPSARLMCVDLANGERKWSQDRFAGEPLKREYLSELVVGDRILALADNGRLVLFAADPAGFRPAGEPAAVCGKTVCSPAYAGGVLYLRDESNLLAIALASP
jgi:outer membrane protein assembly factor BamB